MLNIGKQNTLKCNSNTYIPMIPERHQLNTDFVFLFISQ
jgi:hypothetical protein